MGVGGPDGVNYGLSKRMVQLYLLCLVREGKIRVSLGRNIPVDAIDYGNIADIDTRLPFSTPSTRFSELKPPEGWELLAPYAAVLLEDETQFAQRRQDSEMRLLVATPAALRRARLRPSPRWKLGSPTSSPR